MFTSQDIIDSINHYLAIITDAKQLQTLFSQGNYFYYDYDQVTNSTDGHIHAYPGIYEGALYFFMIPAEYDNEQSVEHLADHTQCCPIQGAKGGGGGVGTHRIPDNVAQERITRWENMYMEWIPAQVNSEYGMFKAFTISTQDFESDDDAIFLALKENLGTVSGFTADLIVANNDKTAQVVVFDDFIKSVPPFPTTAVEEKFYLLTI